jgi:hypothetical protein
MTDVSIPARATCAQGRGSMASQRSHAKKNAKRRAALKKKQALNLAPASPVVEKKGRRAPVMKGS